MSLQLISTYLTVLDFDIPSPHSKIQWIFRFLLEFVQLSYFLASQFHIHSDYLFVAVYLECEKVLLGLKWSVKD